MPVYVTDKTTINQRAGSLAQQVEAVFLRVQQYKAWMDGLTDASLTSAYGYVQADLDVLRSAISDLDQLGTIYQGKATLSVAKDFRTFAKQIYPFGSI